MEIRLSYSGLLLFSIITVGLIVVFFNFVLLLVDNGSFWGFMVGVSVRDVVKNGFAENPAIY